MDQTEEGEREATSLCIVGLPTGGSSVASDDRVGTVVWVPWRSLTEVGRRVLVVPEGDRMWEALVNGDVCPLGVDIGETVAVERVSVTRETKLMFSGPLVVPVL